MSSGTFGYPLGFATLLAVIGLVIAPRSERSSKPALSEARSGQWDAASEEQHFNIGLNQLLADKNSEAEAAFSECLKRFPQGEYTSRCYLGLGRARMLQEDPQIKGRAIDALRIAAKNPEFRSEASLWIGHVYTELGKPDEALAVYLDFMGSEIRTPQQTSAAFEVIRILADRGNLEELTTFLGRLDQQAGVRHAIAWFANQASVLGDELVGKEAYDSALAIYRSVPPRSEILSAQAIATERMRKNLRTLELKTRSEETKRTNPRSGASRHLSILKSMIEQGEAASRAIEDRTDLDAALLFRRGRCLYYLGRYEEALTCFRAIQMKFATATDAKSAAFAEIVVQNNLRNVSAVRELGDLYMSKYPDAENFEAVATMVDELLVQGGKWQELRQYNRDLEARFPRSEIIDRFVFFQALATFQGGDFKESIPLFDRFLKNYPKSTMVETALYHRAMAGFQASDHNGALESCNDYLTKFPDGRYAGDMRYRIAFIDSNDKETDQSDKIIRELGEFLDKHPDDLSNGSLLCLLADAYKKKGDPSKALEGYQNAIGTNSPDDVIQYAFDSATSILRENKDWAGLGKLYGDFIKNRPDGSWVPFSPSNRKAREEVFADTLKAHVADPSSEQVEFLIDVLVKSLVPRKKPSEIDVDAVDKQLTDMLEEAVGENKSPTVDARILYARARMGQMLKRNDRYDRYLKEIAVGNLKDPSALSPLLLSLSGDFLLKTGELDGAEAMFKRLAEHYADSMFSNACPVGLGKLALARKKPGEALRIFDEELAKKPGRANVREVTVGKLQALLDTNQLDEAVKLALDSLEDKTFRGESAARIYLILGEAYEKKAAAVAGEEAKEFLKQALATYERVYIAYKAFPDLCAEAFKRADEVKKKL